MHWSAQRGHDLGNGAAGIERIRLAAKARFRNHKPLNDERDEDLECGNSRNPKREAKTAGQGRRMPVPIGLSGPAAKLLQGVHCSFSSAFQGLPIAVLAPSVCFLSWQGGVRHLFPLILPLVDAGDRYWLTSVRSAAWFAWLRPELSRAEKEGLPCTRKRSGPQLWLRNIPGWFPGHWSADST